MLQQKITWVCILDLQYKGAATSKRLFIISVGFRVGLYYPITYFEPPGFLMYF